MTIGGFCSLVLTHDPACSLSTTANPEIVKMTCSSGQASGKCIASTVAILAGGALIGYIIGYKVAQRKARINNIIQLDSAKVADSVDIEDIGEKKAFCRCWKSKKFPYCDGSHGAHNKETGDNVGPVIVKKSEK
ncbi:unnamed protein product [Caenorhabditis bovis]|uniref:CDGSH iron-sulfur domain-containing protein 2 homologue n=1 Tax=Caenorhabditis bovis TaxID=2654633 RepID=A0A8S1ESJ6_9PELO|nr:unnamed protein product [Caenorhabditis bovis]